MSCGICPECGYPMILKATDGTNVFIECSNPECDNKWGDRLVLDIDTMANP